MSDPRSVLFVVGSRDSAGVVRAGLQSAKRLADAGWLQPLVCGPAGAVLEAAARTGLPVAELAPASAMGAGDELLERALGNADLVHALGLEAAHLVQSAGPPETVPLVVTIDGMGERRAVHRLRNSAFSSLRGRGALRWLVPGRIPTSRLVQSGLVRGDQVVTLPLLAYAEQTRQEWTVTRAAARLGLAVAPGARVVIGFGPAHPATLHRIALAITKRAGEIVGVWIDTGQSGGFRGRGNSGLPVVSPAEGQHLLAAMDVLVADGTQLAARHAAVDARCAGVPIVTTPDDAGAEMVRHSVNGYVCMPSEMASAIEAALEMAVARTLPHRPLERRRADQPGDPAAVTARCYSAVLGHPLLRPVLIGRRAAR